MPRFTEDQVRDDAGKILGFENTEKVKSGVGQLTSFNQLGFKGNPNKPDGRYLPENFNDPAIILEAKNSDINLNDKKREDELLKNVDITLGKYKSVIGILYNGEDIRIFKNHEEIKNLSVKLENKDYYLKLFTNQGIDKQLIFTLTKRINDSLHFNFGIKNLYHRMIFTACALVAIRYGATLVKGMSYSLFHQSILTTLSKSLDEARKQNLKLDTLGDVYAEIKMHITNNQDVIDEFIDNVKQISDNVNSDNWNGEDVMGIFFNEFNRYKGKSEHGQVFTPDHITSLMYHILDVHQNDIILDAACGSGAFLVKSMCNMIKEAGGIGTQKAKEIKSKQLFGIEFDREIYALACANMLIHKDGKTNLELLDSRTEEAGKRIREKAITKVLMNPPFETKYGCLKIVKNVLENVPIGTKCGFILPDKKLEKEKGGKDLLKKHKLTKIIKLPENVFSEGVTTSIFVFESGIPQNGDEIFACYIEEDGLETVKNQGRQDIKGKRDEIEKYRNEIIHKQSGNNTIQRIKPDEHLSYQMPEKPFELYEEDFIKTMMDYEMFQEGIDVKEFKEDLIKRIMYGSDFLEGNSEEGKK